jgi:hypothetical protein
MLIGLVLAAALLGPPLRASSEPVVYVSDPQDDVVNAYSQANPGQMVLQIQHLAYPTSLYVDKKSQLFVVQDNGWIAGYKLGQTMFFTRFVNPEGRTDEPNGLCGDGDGHVFLTNSWADYYVASIFEYAIGNPYTIDQVSWEAQDNQNPYVGQCVTDAAGDLVVNLSTYETGTVVLEYPAPAFGSSVTLPVVAGYHAIDKQNNLLSGVSGSASSSIDVYAPPYTGQPIFTVNGLPTYLGDFSLDATGKHLWFLTYSGSAQQLAEYSYPGGKVESLTTLPFSAYGLSLSPPLRP